MYGEIPYKFKYMLNKIVNCITENILKNLSNNLFVENKLLLINNYIIDTFNLQDTPKNSEINTTLPRNTSSNNLMDKAVSNAIVLPKYDNVSFSKLSNVFLNISGNGLNEEVRKRPKGINDIQIWPYKDKSKINRLRILLKHEQEKSAIKELSYLKHLSFVQEKLNYYESKNGNNDKLKNSIEKDNKNFSFKIDEEKKAKPNISSYMKKNDYLTLINTCKNRRINVLNKGFMPKSPITIRIIKHSKSQKKLNDENLIINLRKNINKV